VDVDKSGNLYAAGVADANIFPAGYAQHTTGLGDTDGFLLVLSPSTRGPSIKNDPERDRDAARAPASSVGRSH
jgi:hypothetical protein